MNKKNFLEYLRTASITVILMVLIILGLMLFTQENIKKFPSSQEMLNYRYYQIIQLINEYEFKAKENPQNFYINMKLGMLFEMLAKLDRAEEQYKMAIEKAEYQSFEPAFLLAKLYILQKKPDDARILIDKIKEYPNQSLIKSKAFIYNEIGDLYSQKKNFPDAILQYQNSIYYIDKLKTKHKLTEKRKNVLNKMILAYNGFSDELVKEGNVVKAQNILLFGINFTKSAELMNTLALIKMQYGEPEEALSLFEKASKLEPNIVSYNKYSNLIKDLMIQAQKDNDSRLLKIYSDKKERLRRYMAANVLLKNDVFVEMQQTGYKKIPFLQEQQVGVNFTIRNNSSDNIFPLFVIIKIYDNKKLIKTFNEKIATSSHPLQPGRTTPTLTFKINEKIQHDFLMTPDITFQIFARKNNKFEAILLKEVMIPKTQK